MTGAMNYVVGITGGIGSGKSAVSDRFATFGIRVVDADVAARAVVEPGEPALARIADHFGRGVLDGEGRLNRRALREHVFKDAEERRWLERVLHPPINALIRDQLAGATSPYVILVNPLMRSRDARADRILVVDVPECLQIERTMARDNVGREQAKAIMANQVARDARLAFADDVIVNDASIDALHAKVDTLHPRYLAYAKDNAAASRP